MTQEYLDKLRQELVTGNALEHSYRPALKDLIESLNPAITAVNEPSRSSFGAPDFIFLKKGNVNLILGYAETKDINKNLDQVEKTEQLKRYLGYSNLILTNYIEFRFFKNGEKYQTLTIAKNEDSKLILLEENFSQLEHELRAFLESKPETITSGKRLAEIMGGKAARIRANVINFLKTENDKNEELLRIYKIIQKLLVHDLETSKFADMYAQTLVYGLFVARYYDTTPEIFSRQEARDLIPASNPFLRHFFDHIAGPNFDRRLSYIVDELCDVFTVSDIQAIIQKHYSLLGTSLDKDPIIHFYEDFLKEYDPQLKRQMGAYYTPVPVVYFIVRAVDYILKTEFNLHQGLASTEMIDHQVIIQGKKSKRKIHKVQLLDPAVGTATFLNEAIKFIYSGFKNQEGVWRSYVENELLPRVYGFELMMAPYTIAHLKLAMTLKETGVKEFHKRLRIYLTNTLEEGFKIPDDLFSSFGLIEAISEEARSAGIVKNETPIMVIIGNPPYSGESFNKSPYAMSLVEKYKFEPGGKEKLHERNPKWINDDYVKFLAFAQDMVSRTGEGIVAMITNHSYLDNPTFRGMRWNLVNAFSNIYILDLHGSIKRSDISPNESKDENVFDIQQGVSIIVAIKNNTKKGQGLGNVFRADLWGKREEKFEFLLNTSLEKITWEKIRLNKPSYLFLNKDEGLEKEYNKGIKINELFPINSVGIVTGRDNFVIDNNKGTLRQRIEKFMHGEASERISDSLVKDNRYFNFSYARSLSFDENNIVPIKYRPFDDRFIYYQDYFVGRTRKEVMQHFLAGDNLGIVTCRQSATNNTWSLVSITNKIVDDSFVSNRSKERGYVYPLYLYTNNSQSNFIETLKRKPNLNINLVNILLSKIDNYNWVEDHENKKSYDKNLVSPLDIFDYVYAVLHSTTYRSKYKEFLKADFPRIPTVKNSKNFWKLAEEGEKLRKLHLLENIEQSNLNTTYPVTGSDLVEKAEFDERKIFINENQYFDNIPEEIWNFYIGGYQPAQKWLKDRKGKKLNYENIIKYQKIIYSIEKTIEVIESINKV